MNIQTVQTGCIGENCYLVNTGNKLFVIDPGADGEVISRAIQNIDGNPGCVEILLTHSHADHIGAVPYIAEKYNAVVRLAAADRVIYHSPDNAFPPYIPLAVGLPETVDYTANSDYTVIATPGHTPGGVCLLFRHEDGSNHLFTGDTLFAGSIGRTDFELGSMPQLSASLEKLVNAVPEDTIIYPGHGETSTIGHEKKYNPYL